MERVVIIPTYNEKENIESIITAVMELPLEFNVLVIDDGSPDGTAEIVKKLNIDVFVVGDDWTGKYDYLRDLGVTVFYFPYGKGVSTTQIKKDIISNYEAIKGQIDNQPNPDVK